MASLVQTLAAGIPAAATGTAEFYTLGTSELSSLVYSDSEGLDAVTTTTLDQYGFAERYVGEPVTVRVYDSAGSFLRTFDHIEDAKVVRLESPAFTGPDETGSIVAGGATTEQAAWALFLQSFGATDAYVNLSGTAALLKTVLAASTTGIFYNVVAYGADPTGSADSSAYVQAAVNAAASAGGGVVFVPPGVYLLGTAITAASATSVFLLGVPGASVLKASGNVSVLSLGGSSCEATAFGIVFDHSSLTATQTTLSANGRIHCYSCLFRGFDGPAVTIGADVSDARFTSCTFLCSRASNAIAVVSGAGHQGLGTYFEACHFLVTAATNTLFDAGTNSVFLNGCQFLISVATTKIFKTGTFTMTGGAVIATAAASGTNTINGTGASALNISGVFLSCAGGTLVMDNSSGNALFDGGCYIDPSNATVTTATVASTLAGGIMGYSKTREHRKTSSSAVTTSYAPDAATYGVHVYTQTGGAAFTLANPSTNTWPGSRLVVIWSNASGSNITPAFGTAYAAPTAVIVNTGSAAMWEFIKGDGTTTTKYVAAGPQTVFTP